METESTVSTELRVDSADAQSTLDWYVTGMLGIVTERPYVTMTEVLETLALGGPCTTKNNLIHLLGGPQVFEETYRRMEGIRRAKVKNKLKLLPLGSVHGTEEGSEIRREEEPGGEYTR